MNTQWFVVASQKNARIFKKDLKNKKIIQFKLFNNPLARERNRALIRKQAGMGIRSLGHVGAVRYSETKKHDPHEMAAIQFAKEILHYLEKERQKKSFDALIMVAEPKFLGKLKSHINSELLKVVEKWIRKDLQKTPVNQLMKRLLPQSKLKSLYSH